ncbi:MAG: hypothetical protein KGJ49_01525 [Alphaproteobacteria bacterium]|nr:hypothetical protein [Alphaproteobacteria bacterium]
MQPDPRLRLTRHMWTELTGELGRRTEGCHESGAFLLGRKDEDGRRALSLVYYDELDPRAYDSGVCILHADAFGRLWERCAELGLAVVADVHVHGCGAAQSRADRENPMIARPGHLALILPLMARVPVRRWAVGLYEYLGDHRWRAHGGCNVARVLKIEDKP